MAAAKKPVPIWKAADLSLDAVKVGAAAARLLVRDVAIPQRESTLRNGGRRHAGRAGGEAGAPAAGTQGDLREEPRAES